MLRLLRISAAAVCLAAGGSQAHEDHDLMLTGACDDKNVLNGARFRHVGDTASGTPYYKAVEHDHYLFHDPDCNGRGDGTPRWILSVKAPDPSRTADLDGDDTCDYWARVDSEDQMPPTATSWHMKCGEKWESRFVALVQAATLAATPAAAPAATAESASEPMTSTTEAATPAATPAATAESAAEPMTSTTEVTSTTATGTQTTTTYMPRRIEVTGACEYKGYLNGMEFVFEGRTMEGAPFYKGLTENQYIYHDADCFGDGAGSPRWVLDDTRPLLNRSSDLDADGGCRYHARVDSSNLVEPPENATWTMFCGGAGWEERQLVMSFLDKVVPTPAPPATPAAPAPGVTGFRLNGVCEGLKYLEDAVLLEQGLTADGARFFKGHADGSDVFVYHDAHCDGEPSTSARWVLDEDAPNVTRASDLDGDGQCHYYARASSGNSSMPALSSFWRMYCDGAWEDVLLNFTAVEVDAGLAHNDGHTSSHSHDSDEAPASLHMEGACEEFRFANAMSFFKDGVTANGAPFYKGFAHNEQAFFLYQDPSCDGAVGMPPRWILDENAPNVTSVADLDGDGQCDYFARLVTNATSHVPASAIWHMDCGDGWRDVELNFTADANTHPKHAGSEDGVVTAGASSFHLATMATVALVASGLHAEGAAAW